MNEKRTERCEMCRFWIRIHQSSEIGECHRYPPVLCEEAAIESKTYDLGSTVMSCVNEGDYAWCFPRTADYTFCGEWQGKLPLPVVDLPGELNEFDEKKKQVEDKINRGARQSKADT